jgi:23S rRNA (cytidine1920-2'-O)/16S rRNA (cytidine1409-2'-O)-methyltransferase
MSDRIDKMLVKAGLVSTRSQAVQLIKEGVVFYKNKQISKASFPVESEGLEVRKDVQYVGRGAHKIEGAINKFKVKLEGQVIADVGACTGGFTDYVLKSEASKSYAIDVGHDQLAKSLREDPRVVNMEGVNIRNPIAELEGVVDLAVVDLSYISLKLTLESIFSLVKDDGEIIALVKPQFEVGKENLSKGGIVKDDTARLKALRELYKFCTEKRFYVAGAMRSPITGKTGNIEYFFYFKKDSNAHAISEEELLNI